MQKSTASPRQPKYFLGGMAFATKKALKEYCQWLAKHYGAPLIGQRHGRGVTVSDPAHHDFLIDLLHMHPSADDRIGVGLASFEVVCQPEFYTNVCFYVRRVDGTRKDFSWQVCIDGENKRASFLLAARYAVEDQTLSFKHEAFAAGPVCCAVTGVLLTASECHVDHAWPATFSSIVAAYNTQVPWQSVKLIEHPHGTGKIFANASDAQHFADYHRSRARLRLVASKVNVAMGNRPPPVSP